MKKIAMTLVACAVATGVMAETKPFQASLTPDIAIHSSDTRINGLALSIWGENPQSAFALGFVNGSSGDSAGLSLGLFNYAESYTGVQWAIANCATGEFVGWQGGFVNYAESMKGLQSGAVNIADKLTGLQLGFVNYAETVASGVQIGFANIIPQNEWFSNFPKELAKGFVFVNWRFE
jgi:hypothetical protein